MNFAEQNVNEVPNEENEAELNDEIELDNDEDNDIEVIHEEYDDTEDDVDVTDKN